MIIDKEKQKEERIQDKIVFLYKLYDISLKSSQPKTPELVFIQDEVNNLEKHMKFSNHQWRQYHFIHHHTTNPFDHKKNKISSTEKKLLLKS